MKTEDVLLIGGPWDGRWVQVPKRHWTFRIVESIDPTRKDKKYYMPRLEELEDPEDTMGYIQVHTYYKEKVYSADRELYFIFRHQDVDDVMRHLIEGYVGVEGN